MTTVLFSVTAALATLVVVLLALLLGRRSRPAGTPEPVVANPPPAAPDSSSTVRDLAAELERAREEGRRNRFSGELARSIDLDEVMTRTLEAAGGLPGVDAAMIVLPQGESGPLIATFGMTADEAARQPASGPPDGRQTRAVTINYRYTSDQAANDADLIRGGVIVPLVRAGEEPLGTLAVFWRGTHREPSSDELATLEGLAASSGPAIENALRFREARQLADLDALTGLHNRRYFYETLEREVARAQRYQRQLALIVFDLDDFKAVNDRIGHLAGDSVLADAAERVRDVIRSADVACRVGGDEFAVILAESSLADAEQLYRRLQAAVSARPLAQAGRLGLSAGIAELRADDEAVSLFQRADEALARAREAARPQTFSAGAWQELVSE